MKDELKKQHGIPFTQIVNELLNDPNISCKAKGLYCYMFSKNKDWNFTVASMSKQLKDGTDGIKSGLRELKEAGWLTYRKLQTGNGEYHLKYTKAEPKVENPLMEKSQKGKIPLRENPFEGKPTCINNKDYINNKDKVNNIEDRKRNFTNSLPTFLDAGYDEILLEEFAEYWTEHNPKGRKMKFEMQKTFNPKLRFKTWCKNQKRFGKEKSSAKKEKRNAGEMLMEKYNLK